MTKPKVKTYEEATAAMEVAKEKLGTEKEALREFKKENKIRKNKPVEDAAIAKKLEIADGKVEKAREAFDAAKAVAKELKPRKERVTKYEYPEDCTTDKDKKRHRAKMRREAKKAEAGDADDKKPAAKKVAKKVAKKAEAED